MPHGAAWIPHGATWIPHGASDGGSAWEVTHANQGLSFFKLFSNIVFLISNDFSTSSGARKNLILSPGPPKIIGII
jgi:hypothetical protein